MVAFNYSSGSIVRNPEKIMQKFSFEILTNRDSLVERLKDKRVQVQIKDEKKDCIFINADLTHFSYKLLNDNKIRKSFLKNLILKRTD